VNVVAKLINLKCDMNITANNGQTALHVAAGKGHVDVVAKLIDLGCDMSKTDNNGWTALHVAAGTCCR
jgi:ankyrin repeat protein